VGVRVERSLKSRSYPELLEDVPDVKFRSCLGDYEQFGDFAIGLSLGDKSKNLRLTRRQVTTLLRSGHGESDALCKRIILRLPNQVC
jgi:hypothetical protein